MEKGGGKKSLVVILVFLVVMIVGLVVGIVIVNSNNSDNLAEEQKQEETETDTYIKVATEDETYVLTEELAKKYSEGDKEGAIALYEKNIDESLDNENYSKFFRLLSGVSVAMVDNGDCAQLMNLYSGFDESRLPVDQRAYYYGTVVGFCESCGDSARKALYEAEAQRLYDSGEVENYEN